MPSALRRLFERLTRRLGLEPQEGGILLLLGLLLAVLLGAYTIAKVLRDAMFLEEFGALALPYAYLGVALSSAAYVWLESQLARRLTQGGGPRLGQYAAIGFSLFAAAALPWAPRWVAGLFYLWTGGQAMMLMPAFWTLALDVWDSRRARRLFPLLGGCGLIGGLAGGGLAAWSAPLIGYVGLMWSLSALLITARALTVAVERHRAHPARFSILTPGASGWDIVRKSRYIRILAVGLALSVIVGTLVDFQFKFQIQRMYPRPHELTQFLGLFYAGLNAVSLLFQFGAAGWLLQRLGLGAASGLQPGAVLGFAAWAAMSPGGWVVVAMRWIQGILSQTLGKTSTEIYYAAIRPAERRRIKPALDTLVERWSDALAGILLLALLHLVPAPITLIVFGTAALSAAWLAVSFEQHRQYGRVFHEALSRRWIEPESAPEFLRLPSARSALLEALRSSDERQVLLALKLSQYTLDEETRDAVRRCLRHASPEVRAAAVETMEETRAPAREPLIESFLAEPHEGLRRAAVGYLVCRGPQPVTFARRLLEGGDPVLRQYLLDALFDRPCEARGALTWSWIDAHFESGAREDLLLAARALGAMEGRAVPQRLRSLLTNPDAEVRRVALLSAARRPSRELLDVLLPLLSDSDLGYEARKAVAALGDPAVPGLRGLLGGEQGESARTHAARALAEIATPRALDSLVTLVRSGDVGLRHLALHGLRRARLQTGQPVLSRSLVHRLFLRELRDYRQCLAPVSALEKSAAPEVRLLGESYLESADRALERALEALACWYDPKPLMGVLDRLKSRNPAVASPALEYLGHVLPRRVFTPVTRIFEGVPLQETEGGPDPERLAAWIGDAWETGDAWLRACAVRASRYVPAFDRSRFTGGDRGNPMIRAELDALPPGDGAAAPESRC